MPLSRVQPQTYTEEHCIILRHFRHNMQELHHFCVAVEIFLDVPARVWDHVIVYTLGLLSIINVLVRVWDYVRYSLYLGIVLVVQAVRGEAGACSCGAGDSSASGKCGHC